MKIYQGKNIRNVGVAGHGDSGKTSLVEAFLYTAGMSTRLGSVDAGNTITDFDEEETERKVSISTGLSYLEWSKTKINLLDTPGYNMFISDAQANLVATDSALILVDGVAGVEVQTEKVWDYCNLYRLPRAFVLNKLDRERSSFRRSVDSIQEAFGRGALPIQLPIGEEAAFSGIVDLVSMKAYSYSPDGKGKGTAGEIPAELAEASKAAHEQLVEMIAEGNDALMEEFFEKDTLSPEHLEEGLREALASRRVVPILCASSTELVGIDRLLQFIVDEFPAADDRGTVQGKTPQGEEIERKVADSEPVSAFVFKTTADVFAGRISFFKVLSGVVANDAHLTNYGKGTVERLAHIALMQGNSATAIAELHAGDIGTVAKLKDTVTGDTLGDKDSPVLYPPVVLPEPSISFAIVPNSRSDEDHLGGALHRLLEEDPSLRFYRDEQTQEFLLGGSGQQHMEVIVSKLKKRYHVEVTLHAPKVPYRETILGKADVQGRHKKQSGGHGQFGDCKIRMEPLARGENFEFANEIHGGSIPKQYIPAVEKGIIETAARGYLAGFPVVDFKITLYDGSYHDVDSSEMAFKIAGSMAFKKAMEQARPALLEPVMDVEIYAPDQYSGDLIGDINSRRGRIQGMETRGSNQVLKAQVPMAEMLTYSTNLISITQGRGSFSMEFSHYDVVPSQIGEKIVAAAKGAHPGEAAAEEG